MSKKKTNTLAENLEIKVFPVKQTKKVKKYGLLANASITILDSFAVRDIKICIAKKGKRKGELYIQFPSAFNKRDEEWYNVFFPITKEARETLVNLILEEYENSEGEEDEEDEED